ncbi:MAG: type II toxin-antitoxin system RelE/ParE family toxin [Geobacteraceae bacterium]|jgi:plasmid stabilization system protein ParE|nr:type II toxin-antitoxin system RelE/ParE family toxin [Geobacteraceae bacterium]
MTAKRQIPFKVLWTKTAEEDLAAIVDFIADDNLEAAFSVFERIRERAENLCNLPDRGRIVPELHQNGIIQYRELITAPWRIIYRPEGDCLFVMAVLDSRRNLEDLLLERFSR